MFVRPFPESVATTSRALGCTQVCWLQRWQDLLFLHWRVPASALVPHLPPRVQVDTRDGTGWVSVVIFRLRVRPSWLPFYPVFSALVEVNVRTYVRHEERTGVYFLSMHANNIVAVHFARLLTPLPYTPARLTYQRVGAKRVFAGREFHPGVGQLSLDFTLTGGSWPTVAGSVDEWLVERYRAFVASKRHGLLTAEVEHPRWLVGGIDNLTLGGQPTWSGLDLSRPPDLSHFAAGTIARFSTFQPAEG